MRLRMKERSWNHFLSQDLKFLNERSFPSRDGPLRRRVLILLTPRVFPGMAIFAISSHNKEKTISWLTTKGLLMDLSQIEQSLLLTISLDAPDWTHQIIDFSLEKTIKRESKQRALRFLAEEKILPDRRRFSRRFLNSFQPSIDFFKCWTEITKMPPEKYIGVGYKDHGSLGSGLSWKDQMLADEEKSDVNDCVHNLLSFSTQQPPRFPSSRTFQTGETTRSEETLMVETGFKEERKKQ